MKTVIIKDRPGKFFHVRNNIVREIKTGKCFSVCKKDIKTDMGVFVNFFSRLLWKI